MEERCSGSFTSNCMETSLHSYVTHKVLEERAEKIGEEERGGVDLLDHFLRRGAMIRSLTRAEFIRQNAQTPQVCLGGMRREWMDPIVVFTSFCDLRRNVIGSSAYRIAHFVAYVHGPSEVADLRLQLQWIQTQTSTSSPMRMFSVLISRWITWLSCMY